MFVQKRTQNSSISPKQKQPQSSGQGNLNAGGCISIQPKDKTDEVKLQIYINISKTS